MKKLKQLLALAMVLCLSTVALMLPTAAASGVDETQVVRFEDGSYVVITIEYDPPQGGVSLFAAQSLKSGSKAYNFYKDTDELAWVFRVHGAFTYDGSSAEATDADYSYDIYDNDWSFVRASASYSGATATATGSFKRAIVPNSVTLTLTCSPKGVLS